jgi:hypothetical protein
MKKAIQGAAEKLVDFEKTLTIAQVDNALNDIPSRYVPNIPSIVFAPTTSKNIPFEYAGPITANSLINFIGERAYHPNNKGIYATSKGVRKPDPTPTPVIKGPRVHPKPKVAEDSPIPKSPTVKDEL